MLYTTDKDVFVDEVKLHQRKYDIGKAYNYHVVYSNKKGEYSLIKYYKGRVDENIIASFGFSVFAEFGGGSKRIWK